MCRGASTAPRARCSPPPSRTRSLAAQQMVSGEHFRHAAFTGRILYDLVITQWQAVIRVITITFKVLSDKPASVNISKIMSSSRFNQMGKKINNCEAFIFLKNFVRTHVISLEVKV